MQSQVILLSKVFAALVVAMIALRMFLPWAISLRVTAVLAVGAGLIGVLCWPLIAPVTPFGAVALIQGQITLGDVVIVAFLALLAGFAAYFAAWPLGRHIAVLAAPAGLAVWAVKSGSMADVFRAGPAAALQRQQIYESLKWEGFLWLAVVLVGFAGMLLAHLLAARKLETAGTPQKPKPIMTTAVNGLLAVLVSMVAGWICIGLFARDVQMPDAQLGLVHAQPAVAQIAFAAFASLAIAAFAAKIILDADSIWPILGSAGLTYMTMNICGKARLLEYVAKQWPAAFFSKSAGAILPIQLIAFGAIGSVAGFWLAVYYRQWRKSHKNQP